MNQILFSVIGFLMFAIVGIGAAEVKIQMAEQGRVARQELESYDARAETDDYATNVDTKLQAAEMAESNDARREYIVTPPTTVPEALSQVVRTVSTALTSGWGDDAGDSRREDDDEYEDEDEWEDEDEDEDHEKKQVTSAPKTTPSSGTAKSSTGATPPTSPSVASFTMAQVASHNSATSCYSVVEGTVYDLTSFVSKHPGGQSAIKSMCGVDGTAAFSGQHGGQGKPSSVLAQYKIGVVQ